MHILPLSPNDNTLIRASVLIQLFGLFAPTHPPRCFHVSPSLAPARGAHIRPRCSAPQAHSSSRRARPPEMLDSSIMRHAPSCAMPRASSPPHPHTHRRVRPSRRHSPAGRLRWVMLSVMVMVMVLEQPTASWVTWKMALLVGLLWATALLGLPARLGLAIATLAPPPGQPPSAPYPPRRSTVVPPR
jgi:hypothetical protein